MEEDGVAGEGGEGKKFRVRIINLELRVVEIKFQKTNIFSED